MPTSVLLADDHTLFREGVKALLPRTEFTVVGEAQSGPDAIRLAKTLQPEIAVLDIGMPGLNGLDATREVTAVSPGCRVVILSMHRDHEYLAAAFRAGAHGYALKLRGSDELLAALREVARGGMYVSPGLSRAVADGLAAGMPAQNTALTLRERQVLQLIAEGRSTKEVAAALIISLKTAETHRQRIMSKLDIHETASLVRYAIRSGLIQA